MKRRGFFGVLAGLVATRFMGRAKPTAAGDPRPEPEVGYLLPGGVVIRPSIYLKDGIAWRVGVDNHIYMSQNDFNAVVKSRNSRWTST